MDSIQKISDIALSREISRKSKVFSPAVWKAVRKAFTPKGVLFFKFYGTLRRISLGDEVPSDLRQQFIKSANRLIQIKSPVDNRNLSPVVVNQIAYGRSSLSTLLNRITSERANSQTWRQINDIFIPILISVLRDKGIYLNYRPEGIERWAKFRKMTPKQEYIEKLKDEDPESYSLLTLRRKTLSEIDAGISDRIKQSGMILKRSFFMGRPVQVGKDPRSGEERIYDRDGEILEFSEYKEKRIAMEAAKKEASIVPSRTQVPLEELRSLSDEKIEDLSGPVAWSAITDDKAKSGKLTKIFATKKAPVEIEDEVTGELIRTEKLKVIVEGRYKGIFLDDMINSQGRLIEGTSYSFSPASGREASVPIKIDPGQREPYVTLAEIETIQRVGRKKVKRKEEKLYLKLPGASQYKELRHAMKKLACNTGTKRGCIPSVSYHKIQGTRAVGFYFDPKDFGIIKDTLKGMSLSKGALDLLKSYFKDLSRAEQATVSENLSFYNADSLVGFKVVKKNRETEEIKKFDLLTKQKQALAWMDARGNNGVCALDTGLGKSLTSIAMMQKLIRDGLAEKDASYETPSGQEVFTNGRFLFVCPISLKGNLPKEVRKFLSEPNALLERLDIISYREFSASSRSGKIPGSLKNVPYWASSNKATKQGNWIAEFWEKNAAKKWDPSLYVALIFDEASELASLRSQKFKAVNGLYHPRKILLTASPMEKEPVDAYLLASIPNNVNLSDNSPDAKKNRVDMRRFMERYTERVGGRVIGVKQDPLTKRDLETWVKQNLFYADKTNVEEFELPDLHVETSAIQMDPEVEEIYKAVSSTMPKIMKGLMSKFRDMGLTSKGKVVPEARDPNLERAFGRKFKPVLSLLNGLSNYPAETLKDVAYMIETGEMPGETLKNGSPKPVPAALKKAINGIKKKIKAGQMRKISDSLGNPKLEESVRRIQDKLDQTDGSSRTLLFSDDKKLCMMAGEHLSKKIPGWHLVALNNVIRIFSNGSEVPSVSFPIQKSEALKMFRGNREEASTVLKEIGNQSSIRTPFRRKAYRKHPNLPAHDLYNPHFKADRWQQFVLKEVVSPNSRFKTCTLFGQSYMYGHNLQAFDTVIHLDRNTWNSENMKQRTARSWRQGQEKPVQEITMDATYAEPGNNKHLDGTLDEIRKYFQQMESDLFDRIIKDAQTQALGLEWDEIAIKDSSNLRLDQTVLELMTSPYVSRSRVPGT